MAAAQAIPRAVSSQDRCEEDSSPPGDRHKTGKPTLRLLASPERASVREFLQAHKRTASIDAAAKRIITEGILQIEVCQSLTPQDIRPIVEAMDFYIFEAGEVIEPPGQSTGYFFVIHDGKVEVIVDEKPVGILKRGSTFGGDGLLWAGSSKSSGRSASVVAKERTGIWATSGPTFSRLLRKRAEESAMETRLFLEQVSMFQGLPKKQLDILSHAFLEEVVEQGTVVIGKGDWTKDLYFIRNGSCKVVDASATDASNNVGAELARLGPGKCFGERAILWSQPRVATVVALERCDLLRIRSGPLLEALGDDFQSYLERCMLLSGLTDSATYAHFEPTQMNAIVQKMTVKVVRPNEELLSVITGNVRMLNVLAGEMRRDTQVLLRGNSIEVHATVSVNERTMSDMVSQTTSRRNSVSQDEVMSFRGGPEGARVGVLTCEGLVQALAPRNNMDISEAQADETAKKLLLVKKVPLFRHLNQEHTEKVVKSLTLLRYKRNDLVIKQGDEGDALFVIAQGEVTVVIGDKVIRTQGRNACFGERALLFDERRTASVQVTSSRAELWSIDKATFATIVKGKMREELINRIALQDTKVSLSDLTHVKVIGTGAFSTVHMTIHNRTRVRYALKTVKKQKDGQAPPDMKNECSILLENDHPFILYVVRTFETKTRVCMLTELVTGGDLHAAIRMIPTVLSKSQARFYTAALVIIIEALWDRNIVYRDLKPENVMLDNQGYLKLIDFGISKKLGDGQSRTFTMVGTPHYMAPEVMRGRGYGTAVDLWSLGVMLFEFVCGCLPFADALDAPTEVCTAVLKDRLSFPSNYKDADGRALIRALLCRQPERRLGVGGSLSNVKEHPFFQSKTNVDENIFDKIMGREAEPPLVPPREKYADEEDIEACTLSDVDELWPKDSSFDNGEASIKLQMLGKPRSKDKSKVRSEQEQGERQQQYESSQRSSPSSRSQKQKADPRERLDAPQLPGKWDSSSHRKWDSSSQKSSQKSESQRGLRSPTASAKSGGTAGSNTSPIVGSPSANNVLKKFAVCCKL